MDIHPEIDEYIKNSIDRAIGLQVDVKTLESKLRASEDAQMRYREQYLELLRPMKEKDEIVERTRVCEFPNFFLLIFFQLLCIFARWGISL